MDDENEGEAYQPNDEDEGEGEGEAVPKSVQIVDEGRTSDLGQERENEYKPRQSMMRDRKSTFEDWDDLPMGSFRKRRTSLLGNLMAEGRVSRGYSIGHLMLHLTKEQRERKDDTFALPPDDYYLMDEHDALGIFLEKPEQLPGTLIEQLQAQENKEKEEKKTSVGEDGEAKPEEPKEGEPPVDYVFPVARNAVELQNKLFITRNLRSYQENYDKTLVQGKCYYGEDEIDLSFLTSKPVTFLIMGKPGIGKTTLGAKLAEKMHSVHLNRKIVCIQLHSHHFFNNL